MNNNDKLKQEHFELLRKIKNNPNSSQRELAEDLDLVWQT